MKSLKEFCKKHKKGIIITSCLVSATAIVVFTKGKHGKKMLLDVTGKTWITWEPNGNFIKLEKVKEILELNADNNSLYAIVKEGGVGKDVYSCILLNGSDVITSK